MTSKENNKKNSHSFSDLFWGFQQDVKLTKENSKRVGKPDPETERQKHRKLANVNSI